MSLRRTFRQAAQAPEGEVAAEASIDPAELSALFDDFQGRLLKLTPADARPTLVEKAEDPSAPKVTWRAADGSILGAAIGVPEGCGADVAFLHILPKHATTAATGRILDELVRALPPEVVRVRAMDRLAHRWLHLPAQDARAVLLDRGFAAFDRVLLSRDLRRPVPAAVPPPAPYRIEPSDARRVEELSDFAYRAYRGTTDFSIIAPDASPLAYERLYRRFLSGELGDYAPSLSFLLKAGDGALAGVVHTIMLAGQPYVGDLSVLAEHRGRGLGRLMLLTALNAYRAAGLTRTGLTVTAQNTAAYNLYRSLGFEVERSAEVFLLAR